MTMNRINPHEGVTKTQSMLATARLTNGRYAVHLTAAGTGWSESGPFRLTGWDGDPTEDRNGFFIYIRDLQDGEFWSLGWMPVGRNGDEYQFQRLGDLCRISRRHGGLDARLEIAVAPDDPVEVRRVQIANRSNRTRRVELTSCLEVMLNHPAAHAGHPVFSRLFLQTEARHGGRLLLARRRPRSPVDRYPVLLHALVGAGPTGFETDRMKFVGRGRTLASPMALRSTGELSGSAGSVLDPLLAIRTAIEIPPGRETTVAFLLGTAEDEAAVEPTMARYASLSAVESILSRAAGGTGAGPSDEDGQDSGIVPELAIPDVPSVPPEAGARPTGPAGPLDFYNGYGGFEGDGAGQCYVIQLPWNDGEGLRRPPRPWINVLANESFGCLVSETGAGYTWCGNSREHRLTPWANDPVSDPAGESFYLRDEESGLFWSPLPGPAPLPVDHEMRHGFGWSEASLTGQGLRQVTTVFVDAHHPVRVTRVRLVNQSGRPRRLALVACYRLVMGHRPEETAAGLVTEQDLRTGTLYARNRRGGDHAGAIAFAAVVSSAPARELSASGDRHEFLGQWGQAACPAALARGGPLAGRFGTAVDPALIQRIVIDLPPDGDADVAFLFGEGRDLDEARSVLARFGTIDDVAASRQGVDDFWHEGLSSIRLASPSPGLNRMVNGWLPYQTLACRIWGRSALYQSGGAFGFRDQLQDAAALVWIWPELTREQILRNAAHQFVEGDVLHWWHPPMSRGLRTRFVDDLLWLPGLAAFYLSVTGDRGVLDEVLPFLTARRLEPGEDEAYVEPAVSDESASVYEHGARAIDRSLAVGGHGLPLFGTGDWNDGMNRVGRLGRGESVWMGFFLYDVIGQWLPLAEARDDRARCSQWRAHRAALRTALNDAGWDGAWYRRGWYDSGAPLGSKASDECRIDALAQAWAVISGVAPADRAAMALDAVETCLISEPDRLIRLLTPPFDRTPEDPGYIKGYIPGVRENGGQYTHAALWVVRAMAEAGRGDRAARLLDMLNPIHCSRTTEDADRYEVEPYVVAADVYGAPPHVGRGGWTWYTGSAGWMFRVAIESVLGFHLEEGRRLRLKPRLPAAWPGYTLTWRPPGSGTTFEIRVANPHPAGPGVSAATIDGRPVVVEAGAAVVEISMDGASHLIELTLGAPAPVRAPA